MLWISCAILLMASVIIGINFKHNPAYYDAFDVRLNINETTVIIFDNSSQCPVYNFWVEVPVILVGYRIPYCYILDGILDLALGRGKLTLIFYGTVNFAMEILFIHGSILSKTVEAIVVSCDEVNEGCGISNHPKYMLSYIQKSSTNSCKTCYPELIWDDSKINHSPAEETLRSSQGTSLRGRRLTVTANIFEQYFFKIGDKYYGLDVEIVNALAQYVNFQIDYTSPPDGDWGTVVNGSWTGLIKQLMDGDADIAIGCVTITSAREKVVDFTIPYMQDMLTFISPLPKEVPHWNTLVKPFGYYIWLSIIVGLIVITIFIWFLLLENRSYSTILLYCFRFLCRQDAAVMKESFIRIPMTGWILFCLVITYVYGGLVTAYLTRPDFELPITTISQVLKQKQFKTIIHDDLGGTTTDQFLSDPATGNIWMKSEKISDGELGFNLTRDGKTIFFDHATIIDGIYHQQTKSTKKLMTVFAEDAWSHQYFGFALTANSSYKYGINQGLRRLLRHGLIQKWQDEYIGPRFGWYKDTTVDQNQVISLRHLSGAFYILTSGSFIAFLLLIFENLNFFITLI